jgi:hypothetical protein
MPTRHTEHELPGLASNNVPRLQQPKRRLPELDHDDGDKVRFVNVFCTHRDSESSQSHSAPSAKRHRRRKNKGIILRQAWNYIDWEIRRLRRDGELDWEALFNGEILDPKFVTRRTNEVVGLTEQTLRSHGTSHTFLTQVPHLTRCWHKGKSKGPAPERPSDCIVRKKRTHLSATTDPSRSAVPLDESRKPFPYHDFVQHDDSPPTIEFEPKLGRGLELDDQAPSASRSSRSEPPLSVSENERRESILLSFTRARKPTAPYTVQKHWGPTLFNAADQQQDDKCGSVTMTAIPIRMGHADWHKSPENSPAVPRRSLPIQFKTAAAPAISTVSAVSSLAKLSWDPNNTPFRSPSSSMLTRSSAQFIQCSSVGSKAYQDLLSMSFKMESLSLRS